MNYDEFVRHLGKAGVTISEFAFMVKMRRNSLSNYAKKGKVPSHIAVIVALMGTMAEHKIEFREVLFNIEIKPKKPRGAGIGMFGGDRQRLLPEFSSIEEPQEKSPK